jgi:hypothetical protein
MDDFFDRKTDEAREFHILRGEIVTNGRRGIQAL